LGGEGYHRFHSSARRLVYEERCDDRENPGVEEGFAQRSRVGHAMLTYFINRGGRGLSAARKAELQKAKALLAKRIKRNKNSGSRKVSRKAA
jgi:hypothetical protein